MSNFIYETTIEFSDNRQLILTSQGPQMGCGAIVDAINTDLRFQSASITKRDFMPDPTIEEKN